MTKELILQEYVTILNIYATNTGVSKYSKQILTILKGEADNTITVENFKTLLST